MRETLPQGWAVAHLHRLIAPRGEKVQPQTIPDQPFIGLEHVEPHTSRLLGFTKVRDMRSSVAKFYAGDVLYGRLRPYLNKVFRAPFDGGASAEFIVFPAYTPTIDPDFLRMRLMSREFLDFTESLDKGDRPRVDWQQIGQFRFGLPPLPEQRRIVARIEALFARIRRVRADLERSVLLTKRYREAVTEHIFTPEQGAGWHSVPLGEIAEIKSGITLGKRHPANVALVERPYLRVANVQRGYLNLDEIKTIRVLPAEAARLALQPGDILMNEGGDRDKLGRGWIWQGEIADCIHQNHVFRVRLRANTSVTPCFISRYANHFGQRYFLDEGKQTTNLASISMSKIAALPIPIPPAGQAARIDHRLQAAEDTERHLLHEVSRALTLLDHLEQSILTKAFRGELVPQDSSDEPADALLARLGSVTPEPRRRRSLGKNAAPLAVPSFAREERCELHPQANEVEGRAEACETMGIYDHV